MAFKKSFSLDNLFCQYYQNRDRLPWDPSDIPSSTIEPDNLPEYGPRPHFLVEKVNENLLGKTGQKFFIPKENVDFSFDSRRFSKIHVLPRRMDSKITDISDFTISRRNSTLHSCRIQHHNQQKKFKNQEKVETLTFFQLCFHIWKERFIYENDCTNDNYVSAWFYSCISYLCKILVAIFYITLGARLFQIYDPALEDEPYHNLCLFTFTTVTTIGYGNIVPTTKESIILTVIYIFFGVPIVFLVLSSFGEVLAQIYWILYSSYKREHKLMTEHPHTMPSHVGMILLHGHSLIGALLFHYWLMPELSFIDAYYFSYISITTIGFGDISPNPKSAIETLAIILYLSFGIIILSTFINSLIQVIRRLHYIGRDISGAEHFPIYFAGSKFTIRELLELVSIQFEVSPEKVKQVIYELDEIINLQLESRENGSRRNSMSDSDEETLLTPNFPHLSTPTNQRSTIDSAISRTFQTMFTSDSTPEQRLNLIRAVSSLCHISSLAIRYGKPRPRGLSKSTPPSPILQTSSSFCSSSNRHDNPNSSVKVFSII